MNRFAPFSVALAVLLTSGMLVWGQQGPEQGGSGTAQTRQGQNGRANWEQRRQQFRQRMQQRMQEMLGVDSATWKVLAPRIENIRQLQRDLHTGGRGMGMMFRSHRRGGQGSNRQTRPNGAQRRGMSHSQPQSDVAKAARSLSDLLENNSASSAQIEAQLKTLRDAKANVQSQLTKAQASLRSLVTVHQEAQLVLMGILD